MDGSAFRNMNLVAAFQMLGPALIFALIGLLAIAGGVGWLLWHFVISHLQWVS